MLWTDHGGEFMAVEFATYCAEEGMERHLTAPYSPQQNDVVERRNQTVVEMARSMMKAKGMPTAFWGKAVSTAVFILNRAPTKALKGKTPFEAWHGRKPSVAFMRTFGCIVHVKNTKPGLTKLEDRSTKMVFLGYEEGSKAYRLYDPVAERVTVSCDVVFDETAAWRWDEETAEAEGAHEIGGSFVVERLVMTGQVQAPAEAVEEATAPGAGEAEDGAPAPGEAEPPSLAAGGGGHSALRQEQGTSAAAQIEYATPPPNVAKFGTLYHSALGQEQGSSAAAQIEYATPLPNVAEFVDAFHDGEEVRFCHMDNVLGDATTLGLAARLLGEEDLMMMSAEEPATFAVAERKAKWWRAMIEEMRSIEANRTWELVDPSAGCRPIGLKWVYKVKKDEHDAEVKHEAWLVARGFVQRGDRFRGGIHAGGTHGVGVARAGHGGDQGLGGPPPRRQVRLPQRRLGGGGLRQVGPRIRREGGRAQGAPR